jgi:hypothetical protein
MPKKQTTPQSGVKKTTPKKPKAAKKKAKKTGKTSATAAARARCMKAQKKSKRRAPKTKDVVASLTPERTRKMMDAFDWRKAGLTYVEIGDKIGCSASQAHTLVSEANTYMEELSTDYRTLNIGRCDSMIARLWGSLLHKDTDVDSRTKCVNAIDKVIRTQTVLVTGAPMGSGGQAAVQGSFQQMLPSSSPGAVDAEETYNGFGGTEDLEDAANIIELSEEDITTQT